MTFYSLPILLTLLFDFILLLLHLHLSFVWIFFPQEADVKIIRDAKIREGMLDREASLQRARREASLADGVSWGMGEDAIEEDEVCGDL